MTSEREKLESETLGQLADRMQDGPDSDRRYFAPLAEIERRKAAWMKASADAQIEAVEAAKEAARYTKRTTLYMLLSARCSWRLSSAQF
jgi:hypothetical protein